MTDARKKRLLRVGSLLIILFIGSLYSNRALPNIAVLPEDSTTNLPAVADTSAGAILGELAIKGRAPKTGYEREQFTKGWNLVDGCDVRNRILTRDLQNITYLPTIEPVVCKVVSGQLNDPYTGTTISFMRGPETSDDVQIDHVVALSDAWQKGAQQLDYSTRNAFANDSLNLLAVDGPTNQQKSDSDAASWLPPNKPYRCNYVTRQIQVKKKYNLWVTRPEYEAINKVLKSC